MSMADQLVHPVLLCGGSGTRLWPLSRALYPKQLLQFEAEEPLLLQTARRTLGDGFAAPVVICNEEHRFLIASLLQRAGIAPSGLILEAEGRNTAPAAAVAALHTLRQDDGQGDPLLLLLPADHVIPDAAAFREAVSRSATAARDGKIVTFGIKPTRAETGYGYIELEDGGAAGPDPVEVVRFVEKPDRETAERYLRDRRHCWNAGIFLCSARTLLGELERFAPDVLKAARAATEHAVADRDFLRLDAEAYGESPAISIDYAVMERTDRAMVLPVDFEWSDIGSWREIWARSPKDGANNAAVGDVILEETSGSLVYGAGEGLTVVAGLEDVVVINTDDVVMVTKREGTTAIKGVLDHLAAQGRREHLSHATDYRPWGSFKGLGRGVSFQVKELNIEAGASISLQFHNHRSEHWVVVKGVAEVTRGDEVFELKENESTFIAPKQIHRLANRGPGPLKVIEVQCGDYLSEDDIVRLEDSYGR
ncbi:mannose-1-phosphate guanylyltransferase/mannose-6-phosphate isomerase [Pelagibius sp. CAU 1746]|uniref:mannose-1-phosphate guanylyltransferase/mannose-6-phosphate isomerase n=1 Tax=Pelagibius sp. CAU 1746 TaxID=3140370 RepID=UPI00325A4720